MATYRAPGVYTREVIESILPSPIPSNNVVAIVTEVPPSTPYREILTLSGNAPVRLQKKGIDLSTVEVLSRDEHTTYLQATDYTLTTTDTNAYEAYTELSRVSNQATETLSFSDADRTYNPVNGRGVHDIVLSDATNTYEEYLDYTYDRFSNTLHALPGGRIPTDGTQLTLQYKYGIEDGETVVVQYRYADEEYYSPHLFGNSREVFNLYGEPWTDEGPNPASLAASLVFVNGGTETQVLVVPVNPHSSNIEKDYVTLADWQIALENLNDDYVYMVCETSGDTNVHSFVVQNVSAAVEYSQFRMAFLGRDGVRVPIGRQELRDYAEAINNQRVVMVSPAVVQALDTVGGDLREVGGQYAACALAGLVSRLNFYETPTRRPVAGVVIPKQERETLLTADSASGLCVIENRRGFMRVRHGLTTMFSDINRREIAVVRAKDFMIKSMKEALDNSVIGLSMEPNTDMIVAAAATSVLDRMVNSYVIAAYNQPQVLQDTSDPTRLLLRFSYLPNYPMNEILIEFSITPFGASVNEQ